MNIYEKKPVNYERLLEAVNKDFATYGDMLQYLIIRPYNLPSQYSATIFSVTSLFETLMRYYGNLLASFIGIALLNKGFEYFPFGPIKSHEEVVSYYEYLAISGTSEPSDHLLFSSKDESQLISINIVKQRPYLLDGGEVGFSIEEAFDDLIKAEQEYQEWEKKNGLYIDDEMEEKLNIPEDAYYGSFKEYVIPDPFLFHLFKDEIKQNMKKVNEFFPNWELISAEQFIEQYLAEGKDDYVEYFKGLLNNAKKNIEEKYPFISVSKQHSLLSKSREEILKSVHMAYNLTSESSAEIIRKATLGVEGLLYSLGWKYQGAEPEGRDREFNPLLTKFKEYLKDDFGEDILNDLLYLNKMRNQVSHPDIYNPNSKDVVKTTRKAELFLYLVDQKYGFKP